MQPIHIKLHLWIKWMRNVCSLEICITIKLYKNKPITYKLTFNYTIMLFLMPMI